MCKGSVYKFKVRIYNKEVPTYTLYTLFVEVEILSNFLYKYNKKKCIYIPIFKLKSS